MATIARFNGLNNVTDPLRLGLGWLTQADNVDITDTGAIKKREGYSLVEGGAPSSAYATADESRLYVVASDGIKVMTDDGLINLSGGEVSSDQPMHFCEVNDQVFFNNGADDGIISPDGNIALWRASPLREWPLLDAEGNEVPSLFEPLPLGAGIIQHWRGRIYAAQYFPDASQTAVWFSQPLGFHLFNLDTDFVLISGQVTMLAPHADALIIGTDSAIYAYDGTGLAQLAPYGAIPGQNWVDDEGRILFWTQRGLCAALPFSNLTDRQISVAPGSSAGGALVHQDGRKRYLVSIQPGGNAFNQKR